MNALHCPHPVTKCDIQDDLNPSQNWCDSLKPHMIYCYGDLTTKTLTMDLKCLPVLFISLLLISILKARQKVHLIDHLVYPPNLTTTMYFIRFRELWRGEWTNYNM